MKYVYGPVPSRRLGQSLGIDPIPLKTCNWNCVYCQLGRTVPLVSVRKEYAPPDVILDEIQEALATADAVMPSLDTGKRALYLKVNRPHPEVTYERLVKGLTAFRRVYQGELWPEVTLIWGLNDTEEALSDIATILRRVRPDWVAINLPTRPPVETWVQPPDKEGLMQAVAILGDAAEVIHPIEGTFDLGDFHNVVEAVVGLITRYPMRQEELERTLEQWAPGQVSEALGELEASGEAQVVERYGARFWPAAPSHFPDEARSQAVAPGRGPRH